MNNPDICATAKHPITPAQVGSRNAASAHFQPPASFFTVSSEVEQGQCMSENSIVQTAVRQVQPLSPRSCANAGSESSVRLPCDM